MRYTARALQPPTNRGTKWTGLYVPKNAYFGQNLACLGPKILILTRGSKSFVTHVTEKTPGHLVRIVFRSAWGIIGRIAPKFLIPRDKNVQFGPQNLDIWEKSNFFVLESRFLSTGHVTSIPGATTYPFGHPPKNFRFRAMGHFLGLTPFFGHFTLVSLRYYEYPLILDHRQRNLVGPSGPSKIDPQWQQTWSQPELRTNVHFSVWPKSIFLAKNPCFSEKKHPNFA